MTDESFLFEIFAQLKLRITSNFITNSKVVNIFILTDSIRVHIMVLAAQKHKIFKWIL